MKFTFKGEANEVGPGWHKGFNDGLEYYRGQLIHRRILKFCDIEEYTNGWAEANITAYSELHEHLESTIKNRLN